MELNERYKEGERVMEELFPPATLAYMEHIKEASPKMWDMIVGFGFGELYTGSLLSLKTREIITLTTLITQGAFDQLRVHLPAALRSGLTEAEIKELIIHCIGYTGFPKAVQAMGLAAEVFAETADEMI
ncbi:carboxymuconolactone decarboxylase family protein [Sporosarcina koreensis]|uniref:carboxymuconolactone decarboxylase family protein n=1 Tax=Sporosarcina koreensis TaxID=334735 RepID=UPI00058D0792|nr:carboxymuconolactone decarboxylase family protein [Sporosarcina koreensis]